MPGHHIPDVRGQHEQAGAAYGLSEEQIIEAETAELVAHLHNECVYMCGFCYEAWNERQRGAEDVMLYLVYCWGEEEMHEAPEQDYARNY